MSIAHDGEARTFCRCGAHARNDGPISIMDFLLGGNLAWFFSLAGEFYSLAGFLGAVDVGAAVTDIRGAHSQFIVVEQRHMGERVTFEEGIQQNDHRRTDRVLSEDLSARQHEVAESLLRDLFDAIGGMRFTPFLE